MFDYTNWCHNHSEQTVTVQDDILHDWSTQWQLIGHTARKGYQSTIAGESLQESTTSLLAILTLQVQLSKFKNFMVCFVLGGGGDGKGKHEKLQIIWK